MPFLINCKLPHICEDLDQTPSNVSTYQISDLHYLTGLSSNTAWRLTRLHCPTFFQMPTFSDFTCTENYQLLLMDI